MTKRLRVTKKIFWSLPSLYHFFSSLMINMSCHFLSLFKINPRKLTQRNLRENITLGKIYPRKANIYKTFQYRKWIVYIRMRLLQYIHRNMCMCGERVRERERERETNSHNNTVLITLPFLSVTRFLHRHWKALNKFTSSQNNGEKNLLQGHVYNIWSMASGHRHTSVKSHNVSRNSGKQIWHLLPFHLLKTTRQPFNRLSISIVKYYLLLLA